jgi:hypothetical protein
VGIVSERDREGEGERPNNDDMRERDREGWSRLGVSVIYLGY